MSDTKTARTYNQNHVPRKYTPGRRRVSIYIAWSYPAEASRNPSELDNRFSTMTEVRRVAWPAYEAPEWSDPLQFQQGIAGALELFFWAWVPFQQFVGETTGHVRPGVPARRPGGLHASARRAGARRHGHPVRVRAGPHGHRAGGRAGGDRGRPAVPQTRRDLPDPRPAPRRRRLGRSEGARHGVPPPRRRVWCPASNASASTRGR